MTEPTAAELAMRAALRQCVSVLAGVLEWEQDGTADALGAPAALAAARAALGDEAPANQ